MGSPCYALFAVHPAASKTHTQSSPRPRTHARTHSKFRERELPNLAQTEFIILQQSGGRPRLRLWELDQRRRGTHSSQNTHRVRKKRLSLHQRRQQHPSAGSRLSREMFYCEFILLPPPPPRCVLIPKSARVWP